MRRTLTIHLIFALLLSFLLAPFFHLHGGKGHRHDQPGHHGLLLIFHTHWGAPPHHVGETELHAPQTGSKAEPVSFFLFKQEVPPSLPFQDEQLALLPPPPQRELAVFEFTPRTHDPPFSRLSIPRAPPI